MLFLFDYSKTNLSLIQDKDKFNVVEHNVGGGNFLFALDLEPYTQIVDDNFELMPEVKEALDNVSENQIRQGYEKIREIIGNDIALNEKLLEIIQERKFDFLVIDEMRQVLKLKAKEKYSQNIQDDIIFYGYTYQADENSLQKMISAKDSLENIVWFDRNNEAHSFSTSEFKALIQAILERNQREFEKLQDIKAQIINASTIKKLKAIQI